MDWIAVTTAPRHGTTHLEATVASLRAAGWERFHVQANPDSPAIDGVHWHANAERLYPWPNFLQCVRAGVASGEPLVCVAQDDIEVARGLRTHLQGIGNGIYSPYSPGSLTEACDTEYGGGRGWVDVPEPFLRLRTHGACFYAMRRETAVLLADTVDHLMRRESPGRERLSIDGWIGKWCLWQRVPLFHHVPSLVQHVGRVSALDKEGTLTQLSKNRRATDYLNDVGDL